MSWDLLAFCGSSIRAHGLRSLLSILGISIGISAVILLTTIGEGTRNYILEQFMNPHHVDAELFMHQVDKGIMFLPRLNIEVAAILHGADGIVEQIKKYLFEFAPVTFKLRQLLPYLYADGNGSVLSILG